MKVDEPALNRRKREVKEGGDLMDTVAGGISQNRKPQFAETKGSAALGRWPGGGKRRTKFAG